MEGIKDGGVRLAESDKKELTEFIKEVRERFQDKIALIKLFGSGARGRLREDSDLDLLIVVKEEPFKIRKALTSIGTDMFLKYGRLISLKIYSEEDYEYLLNELETPFMKTIAQEGKTLWKRS